MRVTAVIVSALAALTVFRAAPSRAWEPVTALDDPFTLPSPHTPAEGIVHYPGAESFLTGLFVVAARAVPFGVQELATATAAAGASFGRLGASFSYTGTGFDLYGDEAEKAGVSVLLGGGFSAGARLTRTAVRMKGFGGASARGADIGMVWRPVRAVMISAAAENVTGALLGVSREPIEGRKRAGAAWSLGDRAVLFASAVKAGRFDPSLSAGCTVEAARALLLGAAAGSSPERLDFLAAVSIGGARFSWRSSFNRDLGFSHGFSLGWHTRGEAGKTSERRY